MLFFSRSSKQSVGEIMGKPNVGSTISSKWVFCSYFIYYYFLFYFYFWCLYLPLSLSRYSIIKITVLRTDKPPKHRFILWWNKFPCIHIRGSKQQRIGDWWVWFGLSRYFNVIQINSFFFFLFQLLYWEPHVAQSHTQKRFTHSINRYVYFLSFSFFFFLFFYIKKIVFDLLQVLLHVPPTVCCSIYIGEYFFPFFPKL